MTSKLEWALTLAEQGFYVFRLKRDGKKPFAKGWQDEATKDPDTIKTLFEGHDFNIGVATYVFNPSGSLVVVDIDTKEGKKGNQTIAGLEAMDFDFPETYTVITASGGRHLYYFYDYPMAGGADKLGPNVDIKSAGGYVVGPGSVINDAIYYPAGMSKAITVTRCPDWIRDKLGRPLDRNANTQAINNLDTPQAIQRAQSLLSSAEPAVAGSAGNQTTYKLAAQCRDLGLSEPAAFEQMWDIYNPTCIPPWSWEELERITANAYSYAKLPLGNRDPNAVFTAISDEELGLDRPKLYTKMPRDIEPHPTRSSLIKNFLDPKAMSVLYGESNSGKTFVAMDIAFHIATGTPWDSRKTQQGAVFYVAAEGGLSAENRILALKKKHNLTDFPLVLIPCSVDLLRADADTKPLISLIESTAIQEKVTVKMVVIDTLSRAMAGGNENDSQDMGNFIKHIDAIRNQLKTHLLIVHHSGKDTAKGARGHSSLRAATDTEIEIAESTIIIRKQRDMEFASPIGFELTVHELYNDEDGDPVTSCTIKLVDAAARDAFNAAQLDTRDALALQALKECKTGRKVREFDNVVEQKDWLKCCELYNHRSIPGAKPWPQSANSSRVAFKRVCDRLVAFGLVYEIEQKQWAFVENVQAVTYVTPNAVT